MNQQIPHPSENITGNEASHRSVEKSQECTRHRDTVVEEVLGQEGEVHPYILASAYYQCHGHEENPGSAHQPQGHSQGNGIDMFQNENQRARQSCLLRDLFWYGSAWHACIINRFGVRSWKFNFSAFLYSRFVRVLRAWAVSDRGEEFTAKTRSPQRERQEWQGKKIFSRLRGIFE